MTLIDSEIQVIQVASNNLLSYDFVIFLHISYVEICSVKPMTATMTIREQIFITCEF